ncbi:MAG: hypothetical protein ABI910_10290 [Gemmatimonadota bacterium]
MSRITRTLAACSAALTVLAASAAVAQSADSTRSSPPPTRRGMMGPGGGMRDRMAPNDSASPRRGGIMRDRMGRGGRGGSFAPGAPGRGAMMRSRGGAGALMRGITLSTDQEKALRSSQSKHIMASKPLMLEMMSARTDEQLARLNGDQKGLDAATARVTASRTKLDSLRRQRSPTTDLRAVLTPDQQKILDKNLAERGPKERMGRMGPGRPGNDGARGFRDGGKSPRGPRNAPRMRRWTEDADSTKDGVR